MMPYHRRLQLNVLGGSFLLIIGAIILIAHGPGALLFFILGTAYIGWAILRFLRERKKPVGFVPWYSIRKWNALFGASLFSLMALYDVVRGNSPLFSVGMSAFLTILFVTETLKGGRGNAPND